MRRARRAVHGPGVAAAVLAAALAPATAASQPAGAARVDSAASDSVERAARDSTRAAALRPVVVTVLRAPVATARAPFAVSAVGPEVTRAARAGLGLDEALRAVPGVQTDNRYNAALGERISIRGFGARTQFGVRGVKVVVDGIPATLPDGQTNLNHVDLGLLERAEVVRGPASALWGNAAGGVLQLESAPAPAAPVGGWLRTLGGADGLLRLQGVAGGRRARLDADGGSRAYGADWLVAGSRLDYDGFRDWSMQRSTRALARAGVETGAGVLRGVYTYVDYDAQNPGSLSDSARRADPSQAFANNVRMRTGETGRQGQLGLTWDGVAPAGRLTASAFGLARAIDNPIPGRVVVLDRGAGGARAAYTSCLRAGCDASDAPVRVSVGGEAQRQRDDRRNYVNVEGTHGALVLDQLEHVTNLAAFAQADARLGARTTLLAGLRHDRVRFAAADRLVTAQNPDDSGERTMSATSPSVGVSVQAARRLSVYANVATAFETPTTTELANQPSGAGGFNPALEPQRARSFEVGANGSFVGGSLVGTYQLSAYRARLSDALVPFEVPDAPGRQFYRNAGRATHRGVEAATTLAVGAHVTARAAYTWIDARFAGGEGAPPEDNRVPGVAPHRGELALAWRASGGAFVELEQRAQSWTPVDDANSARSPGWLVTNLRGAAGALPLRGAAVTPFAGVTNLFDVRWDAAVTVNAFGGRFFEPGPPRGVYVGLDVSSGWTR